jgi:hypothetical protein
VEREPAMSELSDETIVGLLRQAEADSHDGRLVHCANETEVKQLFRELRAHRV